MNTPRYAPDGDRDFNLEEPLIAEEDPTPITIRAIRTKNINLFDDESDDLYFPKRGAQNQQQGDSVLNIHTEEEDQIGAIALIKKTLDELGIKIDSQTFQKTMKELPAETWNEFVIETLLQNYFDAIQAKNEDDTIHFSDGIRCKGCSTQLNKYSSLLPFSCEHSYCAHCLKDLFEESSKSGIIVCNALHCSGRIESHQMEELVSKLEEKICGVCYDSIIETRTMFSIFECQEHYFCYPCNVNYVKEGIATKKVLELKCLNSDCSAAVDDQHLKDLVPHSLYAKYLQIKRTALIERDPNSRWCSRPGCEEVLSGTKEKPKLVCKCGQETCLLCGNAWHGKKTCEKALQEEYKIYAKNNDVQFCPACKTRVEKDSGCNHMTCGVCTYEWCWLCRGEYSRDHFGGMNPFGCPGLSSGNNTRKSWSMFKIIMYRIGIFLLFLLGVALSPIWVPILAIMAPNLVFGNLNGSKCTKVFKRILLTIVGLITFPLTIVVGVILAIIPGTCYFGAYVFKELREKCRKRKRVRERIKQINSRHTQNQQG